MSLHTESYYQTFCSLANEANMYPKYSIYKGYHICSVPYLCSANYASTMQRSDKAVICGSGNTAGAQIHVCDEVA
jgi:hypothetical protein